MTDILRRYATPFVTGLFLASLISGVALFFHTGPAGMHPMHEWLSMVLILPFALHLWRNWRQFAYYFTRRAMAVALVVSTVAAGVFFLPSDEAEQRRGPPHMAFARQALQATPAELAPVLGAPVETVVARLARAGVTVTGPDQSVAEAVAAAGASEGRVFAALAGR